jgi:hypothetical protein
MDKSNGVLQIEVSPLNQLGGLHNSQKPQNWKYIRRMTQSQIWQIFLQVFLELMDQQQKEKGTNDQSNMELQWIPLTTSQAWPLVQDLHHRNYWNQAISTHLLKRSLKTSTLKQRRTKKNQISKIVRSNKWSSIFIRNTLKNKKEQTLNKPQFLKDYTMMEISATR